MHTLMPTNRNLLLPQSNEPLMSSILPLFQPELRLIGLSVMHKTEAKTLHALVPLALIRAIPRWLRGYDG